ncbi:hypothetical protein Pmar_PMAR001977 [Perkinsus marinus ATCC 50983]|uniref:Anoctamin transmembrane domain-containing protein n=1 Tax=Perkinsus marinus (strain ATCC 50983 / TXsc) TaxID=423536 RepID=C5LYC4_PERM5|nr:hypothetical protein Pmar_PMAR001977 [Perkinsus marinus ATCC 50983]EEQ98162.1 hypothetical protein Pmar_PMAR001977 [Perkinsus marinus ATCC 50983]|eukprot:XP_002765445.1 hypothetical protein Pmar_PMAR001977 [Perkinsus marinus ATCC 50983]
MMNSETGQATIPLFVQEALDKPTYGTLEVDGTFSDYSEMVTLYGYMTLFSLAFPLAPLIGVALAALETRVDGFKMFHLVRRPMPANAPNIGSWYQGYSYPVPRYDHPQDGTGHYGKGAIDH